MENEVELYLAKNLIGILCIQIKFYLFLFYPDTLLIN